MMAVVYDFEPSQFDISTPKLRRELGKETADYLMNVVAEIKDCSSKTEDVSKFSIDINYYLALTKQPNNANIKLTSGDGGVVTKSCKCSERSI